MIVKDLDTLQQALALIDLSPVRYVDGISLKTVSDHDALEKLLMNRLDRNDIAIVVPVGAQSHMENYEYEVKIIRRERAIEEKNKVRAWVTANPELAKRLVQKMRNGN